MKTPIRFAAPLAATTFTLAVVTGCGSGPSKGRFETAINNYLASETQCWSLKKMENVSFPLNLSPESARSEILEGLRVGGYIDAKRETVDTKYGYDTTITLDLTEKGKSAKVWDEKTGFCLGHPEVVEILEWTEPAQDNGQLTSNVQFTWKLGDRPSWADPALFAKIDGMGEQPEQMTLPLIKTNKGWRVEYDKAPL